MHCSVSKKTEVQLNNGKIEHDPAQIRVEAPIEVVCGVGYEAQPTAF